MCCYMKESTKEWILIGEEDLSLAIAARKQHIYRQACYHSQQCAEKFLKAVLDHISDINTHTHDLLMLVTEIGARSTMEIPEEIRVACTVLSQYGVAAQYPGFTTEEEDSEEAFIIAQKIKSYCEGLLAEEPENS